MVQARNRTPAQVRSRQEKAFAELMRQMLPDNRFYGQKYRSLKFASRRPIGLTDLDDLPFTSRSELIADLQRHPPFGSNLTFPLRRYSRVHRFSAGRRWLYSLDTDDSWHWWLDCWQELLRAAETTRDDCVFVAYPSASFIGFSGALEAAHRYGALVVPGAGLDLDQQVDALAVHESTVLVCTPNRALRLVERARSRGKDLPWVRTILLLADHDRVQPQLKAEIESAWEARCHDLGLGTEIGLWGFECSEKHHVHVNEPEFIVEVLHPGYREPVEADNEGLRRGELVLTSLGRVGSPLVRYRTGHLVELSRRPCSCGRDTAILHGGVLDRVQQDAELAATQASP